MKAVKLMTAAALALGVSVPAWGAASATKPEAMAMVKKAVAYIKQTGPEKAYTEIDQKGSQFHDRDLYIVVYGLDGKVLAHGSKAKLIGKVMIDAQDVDGKYFVKERVALAKKDGTFWQKYKFVSPKTKKIQPGAVKQSCRKEKGSNETQSIIDACSTKTKPPKLKPDEPINPIVQTASCRNLSDNGHVVSLLQCDYIPVIDPDIERTARHNIGSLVEWTKCRS